MLFCRRDLAEETVISHILARLLQLVGDSQAFGHAGDQYDVLRACVLLAVNPGVVGGAILIWDASSRLLLLIWVVIGVEPIPSHRIAVHHFPASNIDRGIETGRLRSVFLVVGHLVELFCCSIRTLPLPKLTLFV